MFGLNSFLVSHVIHKILISSHTLLNYHLNLSLKCFLSIRNFISKLHASYPEFYELVAMYLKVLGNKNID